MAKRRVVAVIAVQLMTYRSKEAMPSASILCCDHPADASAAAQSWHLDEASGARGAAPALGIDGDDADRSL